MSGLSKRALIEKSITAMFALVREAHANPEAFIDNQVVIKALRSQGGLCKLDLSFSCRGKDYAIRPISLNTVIKFLNSGETPEDFAYLDRHRLQAFNALTSFKAKPSKEKKRTKSGLEDTVRELKDYIDILHATTDVLLQTLAINKRDLQAIRDTPNTGLRQKRIDDALSRMTLILSLNPEPFDGKPATVERKHLRLVTNET